jgi:hypothetical protein
VNANAWLYAAGTALVVGIVLYFGALRRSRGSEMTRQPRLAYQGHSQAVINGAALLA